MMKNGKEIDFIEFYLLLKDLVMIYHGRVSSLGLNG
jgi:hypothetical protein